MGNAKCDQPVGVFDSGVGGISVLKELYQVMPQEHYIYFGDSKNAPYGTRPVEEIRSLTIANVKFLLEQGVKGIVVACNTATAAAVRTLRGMYPDIPLVGIEPAVKPAALQAGHPTILVMATPMTISGDKYKTLMMRYEQKADIIGRICRDRQYGWSGSESVFGKSSGAVFTGDRFHCTRMYPLSVRTQADSGNRRRTGPYF